MFIYIYSIAVKSQLIFQVLRTTTEIIHCHNLDHETRPACKVLRPLTLTSLWVILFPGEAGFLPALENGVYQILAQPCVQVLCLLLVRSVLLGKIL